VEEAENKNSLKQAGVDRRGAATIANVVSWRVGTLAVTAAFSAITFLPSRRLVKLTYA
jgi:hypothetical protein